MEKLKELKDTLSRERPAPWEALPDIALYMDQIVSYMPRQVIRFEEGETLTPAMVNNYIKDGLLPRAEGKRYNRVHLAYLTAICALKQVLSVKELKVLIQEGMRGQAPEPMYGQFRQVLDQALSETAGSLEENLARGDPGQEDLARLALELALRSCANKLACQQILSLLKQEEEPPAEKKHKNKGKQEEPSEE